MRQDDATWNVRFTPLWIGFISSLVLVLFTYGVVVYDFLPNIVEFPSIIFLGTIQGILQLIYFFHIGLEQKPHWNLLMLFFMIVVVFLVIGGSLWIMHNLYYDLNI